MHCISRCISVGTRDSISFGIRITSTSCICVSISITNICCIYASTCIITSIISIVNIIVLLISLIVLILVVWLIWELLLILILISVLVLVLVSIFILVFVLTLVLLLLPLPLLLLLVSVLIAGLYLSVGFKFDTNIRLCIRMWSWSEDLRNEPQVIKHMQMKLIWLINSTATIKPWRLASQASSLH